MNHTAPTSGIIIADHHGTLSEALVDAYDTLSYQDLPSEVRDKAKLLLLDTIGVCIGSAGLDFGKAAIDLARGFGGLPECTIIGGPRAPAPLAALVNGVLAHGQDYDDTHTEAMMHPSSVLVPAALAGAEAQHLTGKEVIAALAKAGEAAIRLALPSKHKFNERGFQTTMAIGVFAAALLAAKTSGCSRSSTLDALGIAGSFASGLMECVAASATTKRIHSGWAAQAGFMACRFAAVGFTGPATILEGELGLFRTFLHGESIDLAGLFDDYGTVWHMLDIRPKLYPCGHPLNSFIECAGKLRTRIGSPESIVAVECDVARGSVTAFCEPWARKLSPVSGYDARFSLPYAVAVMLQRGMAGTAEFSDGTVRDEAIQALMQKISYRVAPDFHAGTMPARVTIRLANGQQITHAMTEIRGHRAAPLAMEELLAKFHANTAALADGEAARLADALLGLERFDDVSDVIGCLGSSGDAWAGNKR